MAPTSSALGWEQLRDILLDPQGEELRVEVAGMKQISQIEFSSTSLVASTMAHHPLQEEVVLGRRMVRYADRAYPLTAHEVEHEALQYRTEDLLDITSVYPNTDETFGLARGISTWVQAFGSDTPQAPNTSPLRFLKHEAWVGWFGALTDQNDAVSDPWIEYRGVIVVGGGAGEPVFFSGDAHVSLSVGECPITLRLNTGTGQLTADPVTCTDTDVYGEFTLAVTFGPVTLQGSKPRADTAQPTTATLTARVAGDTEGTGPIFTRSFQLSTQGGGIYGPGARTLMLMGTEAQGYFVLFAQREGHHGLSGQ